MYSARSVGPHGEVDVILLDTRYYRREADSLGFGEMRSSGLLGETQWRWLEDHLKSSTANVHLLVSSVQVFLVYPKLWSSYRI